MATVDLTGFSDEHGFVIVLGGTHGEISAKSLTDIVGGFNSLSRAIGRVVDPAYVVEVQVLDVTPGSTKLRVRIKKAIKTTAALSAAAYIGHAIPAPKDIIGGIASGYLYDMVKPQEPCHVHHLEGGKVHIKGANCDIVLDSEVHRFLPRIHANKRVGKAAKRLVHAVEHDSSITSVGLSPSPKIEPAFRIERRGFDDLVDAIDRPLDEQYVGNGTYVAVRIPPFAPDKRKEVVQAIVAVIGKSRGKLSYHFAWNGMRITAPITDTDFNRRCAEHGAQVRQGCILRVELTVTQKHLRAPDLWINDSYEVTRVLAGKPAAGDDAFTFPTATLTDDFLSSLGDIGGPPRLPPPHR